jgi:hypothetical protein
MSNEDNRKKDLETYHDLMIELKIRLQAILKFINRRCEVEDLILMESSFLQLRFSCEIISLGCLVAHGDIPDSKLRKLKGEWSAKDIINGLSKLHPDFYPKPFTVTRNDQGHAHLDFIQSGFLTKHDLLNLYEKCNKALHRGRTKNIYKLDRVFDLTFDNIHDFGQRIVKLIEAHHITYHDKKNFLICQFPDVNKPYEVQVSFGLINPLHANP